MTSRSPTVATTFAAGSDLISVRSFEQEPNPSLSAYDLMNFDANQAVPAITLAGPERSRRRHGLPLPICSRTGATDTNFVVEIESDGTAHLRFGDDTNGMRPPSGTVFTASYRIGNGTPAMSAPRAWSSLPATRGSNPAPIRFPPPAASIPKPTTRFAAARRRPS